MTMLEELTTWRHCPEEPILTVGLISAVWGTTEYPRLSR